jgi:2-polyprenyl-6-hydroxyphenyl methylase/3-demethylubiquinone-9 3-methyltransferase
MHSAVAYHDRLASTWDPRYHKASFAVREALLASCLADDRLDATRWLDAGCGSGTLARWLAGRGSVVDGVDASPNMIRAANELARREPFAERMAFRVASLEHLEAEPACYDGIVCSSVLEYLDRPADVLGMFARVLKVGGILIVSVPHKYSLVRRALTAVHSLMPARLAYLHFSRHQFSRRQFSRLLRAHCFATQRVYYFGGGLPYHLQRLPCLGSLMLVRAARTGDIIIRS